MTQDHFIVLAHAAIKHSSVYCKLFLIWKKSSRATLLLKQLTSSNRANCHFAKTKPSELPKKKPKPSLNGTILLGS